MPFKTSTPNQVLGKHFDSVKPNFLLNFAVNLYLIILVVNLYFVLVLCTQGCSILTGPV